MVQIKNAVYTGSKKRESLYDLTIPEKFNGDLILFIHGYMGFKDWGAWNLMEQAFVNQDFGFCKFNISHNGGTKENGIDFPDLESFANNTYSKEVFDVQSILTELGKYVDNSVRIHLLGHSRGGGIALLNAHDIRVYSVITLAGISSVAKRFSDENMLKNWKELGVRYTQNQRTKQQMPHNYIQYLDFIEFKEELDIEKACLSIQKPNLVIHGDKDTSVSIEEGVEIAQWTNSPLYTIENADHVFGSSHPWNSEELPTQLEEVVTIVSTFILKQRPVQLPPENVQLVHQLAKFTQVDGETKEMEFEFLLQIAEQLGLTKEDLIELFERNIELTPPKSETDRIVQFYRLSLLMYVDGEVHHDELKALRNAGIKMGLNPSSTEEVIKLIQLYPGKGIAAEKLIQLFQVNHN
jgi:uncharacterized protein